MQGRGVGHVNNHIHLVAEYVLAGDLLLHGVAGQAVGPGQIHQAVLAVVKAEAALLLLHRDAGPVGHLQVGAGVGVEKGGLAAVGVSGKADGNFSGHSGFLLYGNMPGDVHTDGEAGAPDGDNHSAPALFSQNADLTAAYHAQGLQAAGELKGQL